MNEEAHLIPTIAERLRTIEPIKLQELAEDMALIKFPERFRRGTFQRYGKNIYNQTTKGWPDAYVLANDKTDAVEATRDLNWEKHLGKDFTKASEPDVDLSGFFFVGGCSDPEKKEDVSAWVQKFESLGIAAANITILVNRDLVLELAQREYAGVRQHLLKMPSSPDVFRALTPGILGDRKLGEFQPTIDDFDHHRLAKPALLDEVIKRLEEDQCALVRGYGACGKTTLAQLISADERIRPAPTYYLDLSKVESDEIAGGVNNELVEYGVKDALFVVDNIHLDERFAQALFIHWDTYARTHGSRLLLLGRETKGNSEGTDLRSIRALMLWPSEEELKGVVRRLFLRKQLTPPSIQPAAVAQWKETFGGSSTGKNVPIDLIAFGAAVEFQLENFARGAFTLSSRDAVDAVRFKYLVPIKNEREKANLLRLAAVAEYEVLLPEQALPFPSQPFDVSANELGIVIKMVSTGRDRRRLYSLIHPALGELLTDASADCAADQERIDLARINPAIGLQMLASIAHESSRADIANAITATLCTPQTLTRPLTVNEWTSIVRTSITRELAPISVLDDHLPGPLRRLIKERQSSLQSFFRLTSEVKKAGMHKSDITRWDFSDSALVADLAEAAYTSRADELANFVALDKNATTFLKQLNAHRWEVAQVSSPAFDFCKTINACRLFEKWNRLDMAASSASTLIKRGLEGAGAPQLLKHIHVGLLSQLLRLSKDTLDDKDKFLRTLNERGVLKDAFEANRLGHLCGALMSLSNNLDPKLRHLILCDALTDRIERELTEGWKPAPERSPQKNTKRAIFIVCLLGSFASLGGKLRPSYLLRWPPGIALEQLLKSSLLANRSNPLGMYELQFWLGLREFAVYRCGPSLVPQRQAEEFERRLSKSSAPTPQAQNIKAGLLSWLAECRQRDWCAFAKDRGGW